MSITTVATSEEAYADRWRHWQERNAESNRKGAVHARIVFAAIFIALGGWIGLQLMSLPL